MDVVVVTDATIKARQEQKLRSQAPAQPPHTFLQLRTARAERTNDHANAEHPALRVPVSETSPQMTAMRKHLV